MKLQETNSFMFRDGGELTVQKVDYPVDTQVYVLSIASGTPTLGWVQRHRARDPVCREWRQFKYFINCHF